MHWKSLTRRSLLRGAGGVALGLPFLEATAGKAFSQTGAPLRFLVFVHGQGTVMSRWKPKTTGTTFDMPQLIAPLLPLKDKVNVWSGINNVVRDKMTSNGHNAAGRSLLSAHVFKDPANEGSASAGPSIDQVLASRIQGPTRLKTLDLRVGGGVGEYQMQFSAPGVGVSAIADPRIAFTKLTQGITTTPGTPVSTPLSRLQGNRTSVLSAVKDNLNSVKGALGREDRLRLEAHAARIEEMEKELKPAASTAPVGAGCQKVDLGLPTSGFNPTDGTVEDKSSRGQALNAVMALSCDQTRVTTIQYVNYHGPTFDWLNVNLSGNWHDRVHNHGGDNVEGMARAFQWYGEEFAFLCTKLNEVDEGGVKLLDNTLCLWISEFGDGGSHDTHDLPVVLVGGLGGKLKTGRHLAFNGRTHNDLYTTILNLFGGTDKEFGLPGSDVNKGPLPIT